MLQRQTSAADVFELQLPCSMVSRPRKVANVADGSLNRTGAGTEALLAAAIQASQGLQPLRVRLWP